MRPLLRRGLLSATTILAGTALAIAPVAADELGVAVVQEANGIATGPDSVEYNTSGALLLDHFFFRDVNDDQHLHVLEASIHPSSLHVGFSDKSQDEQFEYRVAHQRVSAAGLIRGHREVEGCVGKCIHDAGKPDGDYVFVLTGFRFRFVGDLLPIDRHIDEIGILENEGLLTHYFNDQNDDDSYDASIDYMWVPRARLSSVSQLSGDGDDSGTVRRQIPAGNKVIRGFYVDNTDNGDNHIKRFGFQTNATNVDIWYGDNDPSLTDWFYEFRYGILS